jgi:glycosyltransferase involved in cell wall biosynthesis
MKVSIITVVYNNQEFIRCAIDSVLAQDYEKIEYIVIDGASDDGTKEIIESYGNRISNFTSEKDNGIYDAINKGIRLATGDIVGVLHSDDFYAEKNSISRVVRAFKKEKTDSVFADLVYIDPLNSNQITRYYNSGHFSPAKFSSGWMPAHPTFFTRKDYYQKHGLYNTDYSIASDFELLCRFFHKHKLSYKYLPIVLVVMRKGGLSTRNLKSNWIVNREMVRACRENGISTNYFLIYSKYFFKFWELFFIKNKMDKKPLLIQ